MQLITSKNIHAYTSQDMKNMVTYDFLSQMNTGSLHGC